MCKEEDCFFKASFEEYSFIYKTLVSTAVFKHMIFEAKKKMLNFRFITSLLFVWFSPSFIEGKIISRIIGFNFMMNTLIQVLTVD